MNEYMLPFHEYILRFFQEYDEELTSVCSCLKSAKSYLMLFCFAAFVLVLSDIVYMMHKEAIPHSPLRNIQPLICCSVLKASKLVSCGASLVNYASLLTGLYFNSPVMLMPFLVLQFINIVLFFHLILFSTVFRFGSLKNSIVGTFLFMAFNWTVAFCEFRKMAFACDSL